MLVILEKMRVYGLGIVVDLIHQGRAVGAMIFEGTLGAVGNADIEAADLLFGVNVVGGENDIILAVLFDYRGRPDRLIRAFIGGHIENALDHFKMLEILSDDEIEVGLLLVGQRVGDVEIDLAVIDA